MTGARGHSHVLTPEHTGDTIWELSTHYHDPWKEDLGHEGCGKIHISFG